VTHFLTEAESEFGADIIISRLAEAGIHAWPEPVPGGPLRYAGYSGFARGAVGRRNVYVEESDLARARAVLAEAESVDEDELARLAEESGPPPRV
jgi:Putative prokaryotic signal transducing protein